MRKTKFLLSLLATLAIAGASAPVGQATTNPPPPGGYHPLTQSGDFPVPASVPISQLPNDQQAAAMVHMSPWEPRPADTRANWTGPPAGYVTQGNSAYPRYVWARIDGRIPIYHPTTDEIIQWAAAKWGLSDELVRAEMVQESHWYQGLLDANGVPVFGHGFGDYAGPNCTNTRGAPDVAPAYQYSTKYGGTKVDYSHPCRVWGPESYGMPQVKWWVFVGSYPWSQLSTAYALDLYAAVIRAEYEGLNQWQRGYYLTYKQNPGGSQGVWGAVGNWYSGGFSAGLPQSQWTGTPAQKYATTVQSYYQSKPWEQAGF